MINVVGVLLHKKSQFKGYAVERMFASGEVILWKTFVLRKDALAFAKREAKVWLATLIISLGKQTVIIDSSTKEKHNAV